MNSDEQPPQCNENWHVFAGGFPSPGDRCQCGLETASAKLGVLGATPAAEKSLRPPVMNDDAPLPEGARVVTTELGLEVLAPPAQEWREHTAERWKKRDPEGYEFALWLVRGLGLTNKSKLQILISEQRKERKLEGISRNSIIALFNDSQEFKPGEIDEIIRRRSSLLSADALDKLEELLDLAKSAKDLGAAAMALTAVYNVKQISSGGATRISGSTADGQKARAFDEFRKRAQQRLKESPPHRELEVMPVVEKEREMNDQTLPTEGAAKNS